MPRSAKPEADATLILESFSTLDEHTSATARAFLWAGIDITIHQREVALALLAKLEAVGDRAGVLDDMRLILKGFREPVWPVSSPREES